MQFTYRPAMPQERAAVIDFINYVFSHDHRPHDFKALLPKEYGDHVCGEAIHFLALDETDHIRGCVAVRPLTLHVGGTALKCGFIGSVSVHPYARGEGHMKHLMAMAEDWMRENRVDLGILGGQRQRYQYFGYTKGGMQVQFTLNSANVRHCWKDVADIRLEEITCADDPRIPMLLALYNDHPVHAVRTAENFLDICRSWFNRLYAAMDGTTCVGYLAGKDSGDITEYAAVSADCARRMLKRWTNDHANADVTIHVSPCDESAVRLLTPVSEDMQLTTCENVRIFRFDRVLTAWLRARAEGYGLSEGDFAAIIDGEPLHIHCDNEGTVTMDQRVPSYAPRISAFELQELVLHPAGLIPQKPICNEPAGWFPLPFAFSDCDGF